jgi:hypothetical protein
MDICKDAVGGVDVVLRDVLPNLVEIGERIRMESVALIRRSSALALSRSV